MIKSFDYLASLPEIEDEVREAIDRVMVSGRLILGPETEAFEKEFAEFIGSQHCVGVGSGTSALHLALLAIDVGPGDEVVTVANTCAPTIAAIRLTGATPVFTDIRREDLMMNVGRVRSLLTERTRCILPVHLWGSSVHMDQLRRLADEHGIPIVEDCAQAHGTTWKNRSVGTFGVAGCFSFYPTKNIGALGDAGAVVTDDAAVAERLRRLRMYGYSGTPVSQEEGINGRISELQAAILRVKLRIYPKWLDRRLEVASIYNSELANSNIKKPSHPDECGPTYHQYVIRCKDRDTLAAYLQERGIQTGIHYPVPVHQMPAYRSFRQSHTDLAVTETSCKEILSLPIHESITPGEARTVAEAVNQFRVGDNNLQQ